MTSTTAPRRFGLAAIAALCAAVALSTCSPAGAKKTDEPPTPASIVSPLDAMPSAEPLHLGAHREDVISAPAGSDGHVVAPTPEGDSVSIGLPLDDVEATVTRGGSAVYDDAAVSITLQGVDVSQVVGAESAARALISIQDGSAPREYRFGLTLPEGAGLEHQRDGSVHVVDSAGGVVGMVASPWAVDAAGADVPTRFRIVGSTLVQQIDHLGASHPVIADPLWVVPVVVIGSRAAMQITVKAATKKGAKKAAKKVAKKQGKKVSKVKKPKRIKYRSFTRANFRHNLYVYSELHLVGCDAHHTLPVKFVDAFDAVGINIHHPKWGRWWISVPGIANNHQSMARRYNKQWTTFFDRLDDRGLAVTKKRILKKRKSLDRKYSKYYRC